MSEINRDFEFTLSIKVDARLRKALKKRAFEEDRTPSSVARIILGDALGVKRKVIAKVAPKKAEPKPKPKAKLEIKSEFMEKKAEPKVKKAPKKTPLKVTKGKQLIIK